MIRAKNSVLYMLLRKVIMGYEDKLSQGAMTKRAATEPDAEIVREANLFGLQVSGEHR